MGIVFCRNPAILSFQEKKQNPGKKRFGCFVQVNARVRTHPGVLSENAREALLISIGKRKAAPLQFHNMRGRVRTQGGNERFDYRCR